MCILNLRNITKATTWNNYITHTVEAFEWYNYYLSSTYVLDMLALNSTTKYSGEDASLEWV